VAQGADSPDHDLDGLAEDVADPGPQTGPQDDARDVVEDEPGAGDAEDPRERRHDGRQSRQELRHEQRPDAVTEEEVLGPPYADIRLERHAAEPREDARAPPPPQLVPDEIHGKRDQDDRADHQRKTAAPVRRQRADDEESRDRWQRNPDLLGHDERRQDDDAVPLEPRYAASQVHAQG
jgi:hypothetical protein